MTVLQIETTAEQHTHKDTEKQGVSLDQSTQIVTVNGDQKSPTNTHVDGRGTIQDDSQSSQDDSRDAIERALAKALEGATEAGEWSVVAQIVKELEARRLARASNVFPIASAKKGAR